MDKIKEHVLAQLKKREMLIGSNDTYQLFAYWQDTGSEAIQFKLKNVKPVSEIDSLSQVYRMYEANQMSKCLDTFLNRHPL
jgi:hypothetical protein